MEPLEVEIVARRLGRFRNEILTLMHLHVTFVSLAIAISGALLSNAWFWDRFVWGALSMMVGKQGLYFIDEAAGRQWGTRINDKKLWYWGLALLVIGLALSGYLVFLVPLFAFFVIPIAVLGLLYNTGAKRFHNYWNFGFTWGALPFLGGYFLMAEQLRISLIFGAIAVALSATLVLVFSDTIKSRTLEGAIERARLGMKLLISASFTTTFAVFLWRIGV